MNREPIAELDGGVALITGGAGGIGAAIAERLGRAGCALALLDVDAERLEATAVRLRAAGHPTLGIPCDITDESACEVAIDEVVTAFGGIDLLVNNAGITARAAFDATVSDVVRRVMDVNFYGSLHVTQAALPQLRERRGRIVVVSSVAGVAPLFGRSSYAASKHALHGLFESARGELARDGISVTIACPSFTESRLDERALGGDGSIISRKRTQVGKSASPASVADAIVRAAARRKRLLVLSPVGVVSYYLARLAPGLYERAMVRSLGAEIRST